MTAPSVQNALYPSRSAAGAALGRHLLPRGRPPLTVWGLTPTGVEIAASASQALDCAFDVVVGAQIRLVPAGVIGAIVEDGEAVLDPDFEPKFGMIDSLNEAIEQARRSIKTERLLFRGQRPIRPANDHTVYIVDANVTRAWKLLAAAGLAEKMGASRVVIATAVGTQAVKERVMARRLEFACPSIVIDPEGHPEPFGDPQDPNAERLRSIVLARQAA